MPRGGPWGWGPGSWQPQQSPEIQWCISTFRRDQASGRGAAYLCSGASCLGPRGSASGFPVHESTTWNMSFSKSGNLGGGAMLSQRPIQAGLGGGYSTVIYERAAPLPSAEDLWGWSVQCTAVLLLLAGRSWPGTGRAGGASGEA